MIDTFADISPAWPIIIAGLFAAVTPYGHVRKGLALIAPVLSGLLWFNVDVPGTYGLIEFGGFTLETFRFDAMSRIWSLIFIIAAFLNALYGLHDKDRVTDAAGLIYSGAALGAVFAGDLLTLFFFWELTAISSVFLIWSARTKESYKAGLRYLGIHVLSGVLLLTGALIRASETGSWAFGHIGLDSPGGLLIFLAFGIKCAFPFLHNWLQDAYPKATVVGTVILSAFTTKMAVYALARGFEYEPSLIYIGAIMTAFPVFFAVVENDLRKVLSYSVNNQLGFMVCGIGIGGGLAMNGVAAHAFADILFKGLLFMSMGAVLHRVGTAKASELGGLFKSMPLTTVFCIIGAATISAFPLFSAFVTKAMILTAVAQEGHWIVWAVLMFASAGVLEHSGIKIPYFAFFAHDSGKRVPEAPVNMLMAMGLAAMLCIYLGWPDMFGMPGGFRVLYNLVPYPEIANAYPVFSFDHIVGQMQLLMGAIFAFAFLLRIGAYPSEKRSINLDFDWVYRRFADSAIRWAWSMTGRLTASMSNVLTRMQGRIGSRMHEVFSPIGALSRDIPSGVLAIWTSALLAIVMVIAYLAP